MGLHDSLQAQPSQPSKASYLWKKAFSDLLSRALSCIKKNIAGCVQLFGLCGESEEVSWVVIRAKSHCPMLLDSPPCRYPIFFPDTDEDESWGHPGMDPVVACLDYACLCLSQCGACPYVLQKAAGDVCFSMERGCQLSDLSYEKGSEQAHSAVWCPLMKKKVDPQYDLTNPST
eukprot:scaffold68542_cov18-Tisochrysis_lutea.AAC.1